MALESGLFWGRTMVSRFSSIQAAFAAAHNEGMAALESHDYALLRKALSRERSAIEQLGQELKALSSRIKSVLAKERERQR
jgi:hypothetical protein